jgi:SpoVK/Ycf46/Vps4 family AAA+-type ATPase
MNHHDQTKFIPANANRSGRSDQKGFHDVRPLPDRQFDDIWDSIVLPAGVKERLLAQAVLNFTARPKLQAAAMPLHGIILLVGPPGTGKTSLARGLASRTAASLNSAFRFIEVDPHALASAALGKSQQGVSHLLGTAIAEQAATIPCIVLLDEVETLAASRQKMSMDANPVDVHRATDAVLTQLDYLAAEHPQLLFIATSNFTGALDEAFLSRADLVITIGLPEPNVCEEILLDSLRRLGSVYPKIASLTSDPLMRKIAQDCVGLDGRRIRKAVLSSLALSRETAINPETLTAQAVQKAIQLAQAERKNAGLQK